MNTNNRIRADFEIENYFSKIRASFAKKFIVTALDMFYIMTFNLPIYIIIMYWSPGQDMVTTFQKLIESDNSSKIAAHRCLIFSVWTLFMFYLYFVLIPSKIKYQTLFSSNFGMRAMTIHDNLNYKGKITQKQMFRANFVPVFSVPLINFIFFCVVSITNNEDWTTVILVENNTSGSDEKAVAIRAMFRALLVVVAFLQIHHVFTVAASKKVLNWFVKSNGIVYVDEDKAELFMRNEDIPMPEAHEPFVIHMPGIPEEPKAEDSEVQPNQEDSSAPNFSETIITEPVQK